MSTETIAFIGVGNMGAGMARNLAGAGHALTVYDLDPDKAAALGDCGASPADSIAAAIRSASVIVTMLPAAAHVRDVYENHILHLATGEPLLIDCSTIDVDTARAVAEAAAARGCAMLDAPVSGGVSGAEAGTLAFMVGGETAAMERARPLFGIMGAKAVHCGGSGAGQAAKICNNLMLAIQMISVAEGFTLAERLGLSAQTLFDVSSAASAQCWSLTTYCPVAGVGPKSPADNGFEPGFAAALMHKDLGLAAEAASGAGLSLDMMTLAAERYAAMVDDGEGGVDFSGIIQRVR